jgi:hypothetical protein
VSPGESTVRIALVFRRAKRDYALAVDADLPISGRGSEAQVQRTFEQWLLINGWELKREPASWIDVLAERDGQTLVAEVKGRTGASSGLDSDTMYGQLLRRMTPDRTDMTWAVVVPTTGIRAALRVPVTIRRRLGIRVFEVTDSGDVVEHGVWRPMTRRPPDALAGP